MRSRYVAPLLCLLAVLVVFPTLGRPGLRDWDEAIYASVARQIYLTGDLLRLSLNGEPYYNKPPLFMALTALSYAAFGISEFSARFVSAVFGVLDVLLAYLLVGRLFGKVEGVLTALLLLSSVRYLEIVQHGRMESLTAFLVTLAVYALARLAEGPRWTYLFFVSSGLCVLTKGPMGFLPFAIAAAYLALHPPARQALSRRHISGGSAAFLGIVLPWFFLALAVNGRAFLDQAVGHETGARIVRAIEGHEGPPIFYLVDMSFAKPSAWGYFLPVSAACLLHRAWKTRTAPLVLMGAFLAVPMCILSLGVATKLPWYAFTMYLPAAFSATLLIERATGRAALFRHALVAAAVLLIISFNFTRSERGLAVKELGSAVRSALGAGDGIVAYRMPVQALHFYAGRRVLTAQNPEGLRGHEGDLVVARKRDLDDELPGERIYENAEYLVVRLAPGNHGPGFLPETISPEAWPAM